MLHRADRGHGAASTATTSSTTRSRCAQSLGYLPQRAPLYLEMSVSSTCASPRDLRHLDDATFKKRARNVVEVCGLAQVLGKEIRHLSHGYRQRVGLAQALIHDPPILILDEPTSDLDPNEKAEFLEYLKQIGKDRTVLLSTHNLTEVESGLRARHHRLARPRRRRRPARRDPRQERPRSLRRVDPGVGGQHAVPRQGRAAHDRPRSRTRSARSRA